MNGAGKTSTFRMLTGEMLPSEGDAQLHNINIIKSSSRRRIGYCPQINSLDSLLTARQILTVYAQLKGIDNPEQVCNYNRTSILLLSQTIHGKQFMLCKLLQAFSFFTPRQIIGFFFSGM